MSSIANAFARVSLALCLGGLSTGCATIVSGTTQPLTFESVPAGAIVSIDGVKVGVTPLTFNVKKSSKRKVLIQKDGYREQVFIPHTRITTSFFGNILFGGLLGSTTDSSTGAMYEYAPNQYFVALEGNDGTPAEIKAKNENDSDAKRFILGNYESISRDMVRGKGEHLEALLTLLAVHPSRRSSGRRMVRELYTATSNAPVFADAVVREFSEDSRWRKPVPTANGFR